MSEEMKRIRYTGEGGAIVENDFGIWNVAAPDDHEFSPVKEVPIRDAQALVKAGQFAYDDAE